MFLLIIFNSTSFDASDVNRYDVSLYSTAVGRYLTDDNVVVTLSNSPEYQWLGEWITPGLDLITTLLLCTNVLGFIGRTEPYFVRMLEAYKRHWKELHGKSKEKIKPILDEIKISSYFAGDAFDFIKNASSDAAIMSFPPTYKGEYERLYAKIDEAFIWDKPHYQLFDKNRLEEFFKIIMSRENFLLYRDVYVSEWEPFLVGQVQTSVRKKPVYMYSGNKEKVFLTYPSQKIEKVPIERLGEHDDVIAPIKLVPLTQGQFNTLRSQYLSVHIAPASASVRLAVTCNDKLIGACAFDPGKYGINEAYMMTDFSIAPVKYKRLSKLVLAAALSTEVREFLMERFNQKIDSIFTTAFTSNPISMKYRGLFEVYNRKEDCVNYEAKAGKWTLEEGFNWWLKKHSVLKG